MYGLNSPTKRRKPSTNIVIIARESYQNYFLKTLPKLVGLDSQPDETVLMGFMCKQKNLIRRIFKRTSL